MSLSFSLSRRLSSFLPNPIFPLCFHSQPPSIDNVVDDAVSQFNRMLLMRHTPPIIKFNKILGSPVKMKYYPAAISLSKQMEVKGIEPNLVTLNILINCFCHLGHMAFSFSVLGKILKLGYQPNTLTLTTLIKGLCLKDEVRKSLHFHDKLVAQGFQINHVSCGTLLNGLCKIGEMRGANEVAEGD
ncbi:hypothetical protein GLYMA_16G162000v4 [Glycine max]|uniref:Pentatricopeptide repeat-containing protein, mitochondrial n=1 Tax=Glycine soja TaxID=3848 RepID=A0A445GJF7_GLYSO|nr:hypothetical protein GLYMA_16G162000v4 [Glycine max]RZB61339.1 Pentatricopeptide repeat-containing protein, mitochondrial [Glycine soja]